MNGKILIDSDTLSFYLKQYPKVVAKAQIYLKKHQVFSFSIITRFEILRGMKARIAYSQIAVFNAFCSSNEVVNINEKIIVIAADIYADLYKRGQLVGDADILIAATAIENNLPIVTSNESHFQRIANLQILNWNK